MKHSQLDLDGSSAWILKGGAGIPDNRTKVACAQRLSSDVYDICTHIHLRCLQLISHSETHQALNWYINIRVLDRWWKGHIISGSSSTNCLICICRQQEHTTMFEHLGAQLLPESGLMVGASLPYKARHAYQVPSHLHRNSPKAHTL